MMSRWFRPSRFQALAIAAIVIFAAGCGSGLVNFSPTVNTVSATTVSVTPHGYDLAGPCVYDLLMQQPDVLQAGILVIFERGDSNLVFADPTLRRTAAQLHYSMVWAHQCNSTSHGDLQSDATQGQSSALFAAVTRFAANTSHPELVSSGVILFGYSAAGALAVTIANDVPDRVLGVIAYAPGDAYIDFSTIGFSPGLINVPMLILTNAQDPIVGNRRSFVLFQRGRMFNAPWAFGAQNKTGHCCTTSSLSAAIPWFYAIASARPSATATNQQSLFTQSTYADFTCVPDGYTDSYGFIDCSITAANLVSKRSDNNSSVEGWLPNQATATAWLDWVSSPKTN